jgi:hypothetical protein
MMTDMLTMVFAMKHALFAADENTTGAALLRMIKGCIDVCNDIDYLRSDARLLIQRNGLDDEELALAMLLFDEVMDLAEIA